MTAKRGILRWVLRWWDRQLTPTVALTLRSRSAALTLQPRDAGLTLRSRSAALTLEDNPR